MGSTVVSLTLPEVRSGRSQVYNLWHDSQVKGSGVLFSYTAFIECSDRLHNFTVADFLMAYDKGGHATRPRPRGNK